MSAYLGGLRNVQHSDSLRDYLNLVREVGNFVNDGGFAGNAAGFGVGGRRPFFLCLLARLHACERSYIAITPCMSK